MRKGFIATTCAFVVCACFVFSSNSAQASETYFDGKLEVSGFVKETVYYRTSWDIDEEDFHDSRFDFANTSLYFETIYRIKESSEMNITWFNGLRYWYEATTSWDDKAHRYMASRDRKKYQMPTKFEDYVSESYLSFAKGPWDFRVGKQIVIWGQLDMQRVADVVNPLDLRMGVPGVDNWEEIKKGLWMLRTVYQSSLPGNLIFEGIINPGYFQPQYLPYEGTHWGTPHNQSNAFVPESETFGIFHWNQSKWMRDAPTGWQTDNWELGFRIQGYTYDIDWSLLYWNAKSDGPTAIPTRAQAYGENYVFPSIFAAIQGKENRPREWNGGKVFRFKRYQTFGGTAQTVIAPLHDSVWRMEWFYELNAPYNKGTGGKSDGIYGTSRNDALGIAIQYNDKFNIPWWTQAIGTGKFTDVSITYFIERIFNMDEDLIIDTRNHRRDDPYTETIAMFLKQEMFNTTWVFVLNANYNISVQKWFVVPCFTYSFPGEHWRLDLGAKFYGGAKNEYVGDGYAHKDSLIFRLRYEF